MFCNSPRKRPNPLYPDLSCKIGCKNKGARHKGIPPGASKKKFPQVYLSGGNGVLLWEEGVRSFTSCALSFSAFFASAMFGAPSGWRTICFDPIVRDRLGCQSLVSSISHASRQSRLQYGRAIHRRILVQDFFFVTLVALGVMQQHLGFCMPQGVLIILHIYVSIIHHAPCPMCRMPRVMGGTGEGVRCLSASASFATTRLWWCVVAYIHRTHICMCVCARAGGQVIVIDATLR